MTLEVWYGPKRSRVTIFSLELISFQYVQIKKCFIPLITHILAINDFDKSNHFKNNLLRQKSTACQVTENQQSSLSFCCFRKCRVFLWLPQSSRKMLNTQLFTGSLTTSTSTHIAFLNLFLWSIYNRHSCVNCCYRNDNAAKTAVSTTNKINTFWPITVLHYNKAFSCNSFIACTYLKWKVLTKSLTLFKAGVTDLFETEPYEGLPVRYALPKLHI